MAKYIFIFIFLILLQTNFSVVPLWNFKKTAIDLLELSNSYIYTITDRSMNNMTIRLEKIISKEDNMITHKNILYIDEEKVGQVNWEDIDSFYNINNIKYICPKGQNYMYIYNNSKLIEFQPSSEINKNWKLKCYYLKNESFILNFFIGSRPAILFGFNLKLNKWKKSEIDVKIFDIKLIKDTTEENKYNLISLVNDFSMELRIDILTVTESIAIGYKREKQICRGALGNYIGYFDLYHIFKFYFMAYSSNSIITGYHAGTRVINYYNIYSDDLKKYLVENDESPFDFFESTHIKKVNFIENTKYIYYEIYTLYESYEIPYYGIIDIELNKIIFHTNEDIIEFIPYSNNSMLAITPNSAYKICAIKGSDNECLDECPNNDEIMYDTQNPNQCKKGKECENFILVPENICLDSCDESKFIKEGKKCGLCKDIKGEEYKYKIINSNKCQKEISEREYLYDQKHYLLKCKNGYTLINNVCAVTPKCHTNCKECEETSTDDNNQKCISCKNTEYFLKEGNCVEKCSDFGYYQKDKECLKCSENCKICTEYNICTECYEGKYLDENDYTCKKCSDDCLTCSKGIDSNGNNNCIKCNQNSLKKYLIDDENNHNCVEKCPQNTVLKIDKGLCVNNEENKGSNSDENLKENSSSLSVWVIFIIIFLVIIIILLIFVCIIKFKKYLNEKKKNEVLLNHIYNELEENLNNNKEKD